MDKSKVLFAVGFLSGAFLVHQWRPATKATIKAGIKAGRKLKDLSEQAIEELEDMAAEATEELVETGLDGSN